MALLEERGWPTFDSGDGQVRTFCPVCEGADSNSPSLSVKRAGDTGDALMYCFSGRGNCGLDRKGGRSVEDVDRVFAAFAEEPPPLDAATRWRTRVGEGLDPEELGARVVAVYRYERGRKVRYEWPDGWRKDFRWKGRRGSGAQLYRPPTDRGRWVWLCEGEKDCDRLHELELQATTTSEGVLTDKLAKRLEGFCVAILRDHDTHGLRAQDAAADALWSRAAHVVRIDLGYEDTPSRGKDVSDWLDEGHTVDELKEMVRRAFY